MKIVVEMTDTHDETEVYITDGVVSLRRRFKFLVKREDLHNWIKQSFDTWLTLNENKQRAEE